MKNNPWCVEPFINISHTTDGWYQPCCIATVDKTSLLNTFNMSPLEYMNSDYMKQFRQNMLSNTMSEDIQYACRSCILNENSGVVSRRQQQNRSYNVSKTVEYANDNDYEILSSHLEYVNLKVLGNICNLKCIMCNPNASSKIAAEHKKYGITDVDKSIKVSYDDSNKAQYFQDINEILKTINRFSLIGGEAFVHPDFKEIFELLTSNENSKNIELFVITNGTELPQYVLDNVYRFKKVILNFSIDGVGKRAEYIRNGTIWKDYDVNLQRALDSDAVVLFTSAIQMLSIGYLDEIYDYIESLNIDPGIVGWNNTVSYPKIHNSIFLPSSVKRQYKEKYQKISFYDRYQSIDDTLKILDLDTNDDTVFKGFIQYMKKLDEIRGTTLVEVFPEFEPYY